jgi:hypothetical protein
MADEEDASSASPEPSSSEDEGEEQEEEAPDEDEDEAPPPEGAAPPDEPPPWSAGAAPDFDAHMDARMEARWASNDNPSVRNAGERYSQTRATPLAPRDGFYNERYRCETLRADEIDEERDFEFLIGNELEGIAPPDRVCLTMKGIEDSTVEMLSRFLDETSTRYGDQIKAWREYKDPKTGEPSPKGVKFLYLNDNNITDAGAAYLADALKNNQTVEELYLQYTNINDKGLQHFLDMLKVNKTLKKLELGACGITEKGAKNIIKAFEKGGVANKNTTLEHLGLFSNDDSIDDDLPQIYDYLEPEGRKKRGGK